MRRGIAIVGFIVLAGWSIPSRAELVVTIGNANIAQGSTDGTVNIYLSSNANTPDMINTYGFSLLITGTNGLAFNPSQSFSYLNAPGYVFQGDSLNWISGQSFPPPTGGSTQTTNYTNDTFTGFDQTNDLNTVSLSTANSPLLLASLTLDATATNVNDQYTISLVNPSGSGSVSGPGLTFFDTLDSNLNETGYVAYTSNSGTITIVTASVPETGLDRPGCQRTRDDGGRRHGPALRRCTGLAG